jgi:hypothetical protein
MTANDLIKELEDWYSTEAPRQAATMLRQQQAEIEALRMMLANRNDILDRLDLI